MAVMWSLPIPTCCGVQGSDAHTSFEEHSQQGKYLKTLMLPDHCSKKKERAVALSDCFNTKYLLGHCSLLVLLQSLPYTLRRSLEQTFTTRRSPLRPISEAHIIGLPFADFLALGIVLCPSVHMPVQMRWLCQRIK